MPSPARPAPERVVLLLVPADLPDRWRRDLWAALSAAGAVVTEVTCRPAPAVPPAGGGARLRWLPEVVRQVLAASYRAVVRVPARQVVAWRRRAPLRGQLAEATLVVAGSPAAAAVAAACGTPPGRLWVWAAPAHRLFAGESTGQAGELTAVAPLVGGFLTGSEPARESVERATCAHRTRVMLPGETAGLLGRSFTSERRRRSVLVSGFDLKFAADLAEQLDRRADLAVTVDDWPDLGRPTARTRGLLRRADAVLAEWARTSAAWLSRRVRPDQLLVVRLHRFELDSRYPREIAMENVAAVVYIAPLFGRRIRDELDWPVKKLVYIPNFLDVDRFDRLKLTGARFAVGFVGMEWSRKRFDLALDLLAALRQADNRFRLVVRSVMPWHNEFAWARAEERAYAARCFDRIEQDPLLRDAVQFDPPGQDMARWYRRVGYLASTSDEEGSHASVAEAMAAGTVPVVRNWPGADEVYDKEWVHASTEEAAAAVLASVDEQVWSDCCARARAEIRHTHDPVGVAAAWADLLHGDLAGARSAFPGQVAG